MKKAQLKELIKQSMSEFNDPEYLELMKKADDTGRGYAERDEFRNKAWDLKRAKTGAMTPDEEKMVSDYEEEEANKYALDSEEPLEELISKTDTVIESWTSKKQSLKEEIEKSFGQYPLEHLHDEYAEKRTEFIHAVEDNSSDSELYTLIVESNRAWKDYTTKMKALLQKAHSLNL